MYLYASASILLLTICRYTLFSILNVVDRLFLTFTLRILFSLQLILSFFFPSLESKPLRSHTDKMVATASAARNNSKIRRIGRKKGATLRDVNAWRWIKVCAAHFKREGKLFVPNCTEIVKTSHGRERAPQNPDWYYIRCAAVLRAIYLRPGEGYGGLSKRFGNKKNNGSCPEHTVRSARGLLHWSCKSLSKLGLLEKGLSDQGGHRVTKQGRKVADALAFQVQIRKFQGKK
ncbi:small subunit ribosomal protein S19e [Angomonas deanei]|nr:small subunit ribosomal protein S19e [Angomonas deanei]EPY30302.1 small subunit ribosomal protein S19e [Angomonas deanei]|eukprot:EPY29798.1 small subunit ribosomal protein S19e [Angomonas deanei]